jgi:dTDP-4-dehydrorhamnose reductase
MRVLILGATGMMGHMACRVLSASHEVHGVCRRLGEIGERYPQFFDSCSMHEDFDALDDGACTTLLEQVRPDAVLNLIGVVKQKPEASEAEISIRINSLLPHVLARCCDAVGAKLIQISTDCVFSGRGRMYRESDAADPEDMYGRSKLLGEVTDTPHLTIRTSIIGRQLSGQTGLLEWFRLQRSGQVRGFTKAIFSGLTTMALAELLNDLLTGHFGLSGLYHVATVPISKYDLLHRINDRLKLGVTIDREEEFECDRSLDAGCFIEATGLDIPTYDAMIDKLAEDDRHYE